MRKLLAVTYNPKDRDKTDKEKKTSGIKRVKFTQMLNGQMYEDMKKAIRSPSSESTANVTRLNCSRSSLAAGKFYGRTNTKLTVR